MLKKKVSQQKIKADLKQFIDHYDDSSDEEEANNKIREYDIATQWQLAKKNNVFINFKQKDCALSFAAHAAGLKALYQKKVNTIYYPLKISNLTAKKDATLKIFELLFAIAKTNIYLCLNHLSRAWRLTSKKTDLSQNVDKIKTTILVELKPIIEASVAPFVQVFQKSRSDSFAELSQQIIAKLSELLKAGEATKTGAESYFDIKDALFVSAKAMMHTLFTELSINNSANSAGKVAALLQLQAYQGDFKQLVTQLESLVRLASANGNIENKISKQLTDTTYSQPFLQAYIEDLLTLLEQEKTRDYKKECSLLKKYFSSAEVNVNFFLQDFLQVRLTKQFEALTYYYQRPTLGASFLFENKSPHHFFANLRLSNRSQKRQIKNLSHAIFKQNTCIRFWRFSDAETPPVTETQQITAANLSRKDIVEDLGAYDQIYEDVKQIKNYFAHSCLTDSLLASWIRQIFQGEFQPLDINPVDKPIVTKKLQSITYLLLGCEASRNPATIVLHQMLLDLIIAERLSFADGFILNVSRAAEAKCSPMVPKGAVAIARGLEAHYRKYMPYPYIYSGISEWENKQTNFAVQDLICLEAKLVRAWLDLQQIVVGDVAKEKLAALTLQTIEGQFDRWFVPSKVHELKDQAIVPSFGRSKI